MGQLLSVVEELAQTVCLEPPHDSRRCKVCQEGTVTVQRKLSLRLLLHVHHRWSASVKPLLRNWRYACCRSRVMAAATGGRLRIGGAPARSRQSLLSTRLYHASQSGRSEVHGGPEMGARSQVLGGGAPLAALLRAPAVMGGGIDSPKIRGNENLAGA
jgi:hypothetical protein